MLFSCWNASEQEKRKIEGVPFPIINNVLQRTKYFIIVLLKMFWYERGYSFLKKCPYELWGPSSVLCNWCLWFSFRGQGARGVKLNTYLHLVLKLRMSGVITILSLYAFMARTCWKVQRDVRDGLINSGPSLYRFKFQDQIQHFQTFWNVYWDISPRN